MPEQEMLAEFTVRFRIKIYGGTQELVDASQDHGKDPTLLDYIKWLAELEGLMGIVEDGYTIIDASEVK